MAECWQSCCRYVLCSLLSVPIYVQSVQCYAGHGLSMTECKHLKESLQFVGLRIPACRRRTGTAPFCNLKGVGSFEINYLSLWSKQSMYCLQSSTAQIDYLSRAVTKISSSQVYAITAGIVWLGNSVGSIFQFLPMTLAEGKTHNSQRKSQPPVLTMAALLQQSILKQRLRHLLSNKTCKKSDIWCSCRCTEHLLQPLGETVFIPVFIFTH